MKNYHFARLQTFGAVLYLLGLLGLIFALFSVFFVSNPGDWLLLVPLALVFLGKAVISLTSQWIRHRYGADYGFPRSPEGLAVDPTGVWIDDETALGPGSFVLALTRGQWHRAVVVENCPRDRVLVHFIGWDFFWDEIHPRHNLQICAEDLPAIAPRPLPTIDTSIKE